MASTKTRPSRLLGELLQEEQEPFILEVYLWERGYVKTMSISGPSKVLRSQKGAPYSSKLLKYAYKKLLLVNKSLSIKNCDDKVGEVVSDPEMTKSVMASHKFSSASNTREDEAPTDRKFRVRDSKKHSSASVAEVQKTTHQRSSQDVTKSQKQKQSVPRAKEVREESISLWDLLVTEKQGCFQELNASSQFKAKRTLQQNKLLLFDYVREIIENHGREEAQIDAVGKLIRQKIKEWGKQSSNHDQLSDLHFQEEWNDFKMHKRELAVAIGDDILEELVKELVELSL